MKTCAVPWYGCSVCYRGVVTGLFLLATGCGEAPEPRAGADTDPPPASADAAESPSGDAAVSPDAEPADAEPVDTGPLWSPCDAPVRLIDVSLPPPRWALAEPVHMVGGAGDTLYAVALDRSDSGELLLVVHTTVLSGGAATVTTRELPIGRVEGAVLDGPLPAAVRAEAPASVLLSDHYPEAFAEVVDLATMTTTRHDLPEGSQLNHAAPAGTGFGATDASGPGVFEMSLVDASGVRPLASGDIGESGGFFWASGRAGVEALWLAGHQGSVPVVARGTTETGRIVVGPLDVRSDDSAVPAVAALDDGGAMVAVPSVASTTLVWLDSDGGTVARTELGFGGFLSGFTVAGAYPAQVIALLVGSPASLFVAVASAPGTLASEPMLVDMVDLTGAPPAARLVAFAGEGGVRRVAYAFGGLRVLELCSEAAP